MAKESPNLLLFILSLLLAFALAVVPLPDYMIYWRPEWISLVTFYWVLRYPHSIGIFVSWIIGLFWDALLGSTLGVHAMALGLQAYLILSMLRRIYMFPLLQQAYVVFIIVGIVLMLYRWVNGFVGTPASNMAYLIPAITSAITWPILSLVLRKIEGDF